MRGSTWTLPAWRLRRVDVDDAQDRVALTERVGLAVAEDAGRVGVVEPQRAQVLQCRVGRGGSRSAGVINGAIDSGSSSRHVRTWYFSESRYSSDPGSIARCSSSSNAGP